MKIYTKVILDWNPSTEQYEETYAESYNYEGEVALCQRVGYTGPNLNEILDRILRGGEIKQRGAEATRQFDIEAAMAQKQIEQNDTKLEIERANAANTAENIRLAGERQEQVFDDANHDRDFQNFSSIASWIPRTELEFDSKMSQMRMFGDRPDNHPKVQALVDPAITKTQRAKEDWLSYNNVFTDPDLTASEVNQFAITGVDPASGRTIPMTSAQKTNMSQWAVTLNNTSRQRQLKKLISNEIIGAGGDIESVDAMTILNMVDTDPAGAVAAMKRKIGGQISVEDAYDGMRTIESNLGMRRKPGQSLESFIDEMRTDEVSSSDIALYRLYDKEANITAFTTYKDYSEEDKNKFIGWATTVEKNSVAGGSITQEQVDRAGPMTIDRALRLAEKHGADIDDAGNVSISGQGGPAKVKQTVQDVTTADIYVVQNKFKSAFTGKGAPVNIIHSNNLTGRVKVDYIGQAPGSVGMASQEQYVYFLDESTRVRHSLPISLFKQYFVKGR